MNIFDDQNRVFKELNEERRFKTELWRNSVVSQYGIFGVMAGLKITGLSIILGSSNTFDLLLENLTKRYNLFIFVIILLSSCLEIIMIMFLANLEREAAYKSINKTSPETKTNFFQKKERFLRYVLIVISSISWLLFLILIFQIVQVAME